jgi:hypothetical protein
MRVKLYVDTLVRFTKGSEVEVDEREAVRLSSLGFGEIVEPEVKTEEPRKKNQRRKNTL